MVYLVCMGVLCEYTATGWISCGSRWSDLTWSVTTNITNNNNIHVIKISQFLLKVRGSDQPAPGYQHNICSVMVWS